MLTKLAAIEARYSQIEARLNAPETYDDPELVTTLNREQNELQTLVETYRVYLAVKQQREEEEEAAKATVSMDTGRMNDLIAEIMEQADLVVGLTQSHMLQLLGWFPQYASKITCFRESISDSFGGDLAEYEDCLAAILDGLRELFPAEDAHD